MRAVYLAVVLLLVGVSQAQAQYGYEGARQEALATSRAYDAQAAALEHQARHLESSVPPGYVCREAIDLRAQAAHYRQHAYAARDQVVQFNRAQAFQPQLGGYHGLAPQPAWGSRYNVPPRNNYYPGNYYAPAPRVHGGINLGGFYLRF